MHVFNFDLVALSITLIPNTDTFETAYLGSKKTYFPFIFFLVGGHGYTVVLAVVTRCLQYYLDGTWHDACEYKLKGTQS